MKEAVSIKKDAYMVMFGSSSEGNKCRYRTMKNKAWKAVSKAMRKKAEEAFTELKNCPNWMFRLVWLVISFLELT